LVLSACQEAPNNGDKLVQSAAELLLPVKGQSAADNLTPPTGKFSCEFAHRMECAGGTICRPIATNVRVYTIIDFDKKTYDRCNSADGCASHSIESISTPNPIINISLGQIGVVVKYGPGTRFVDIATQGVFVYVSDGVCKPVV
jgi:hypothetical protein